MNSPDPQEVKRKLEVLALPLTSALLILGWANQFLDFFDRFGLIASLVVAAVCIGWASHVLISRVPSNLEPSVLVARFPAWMRCGSAIMAALAVVLVCTSAVPLLFPKPTVLASVLDLKTCVKDVFHTLPEHRLLPYSFVCKDSDISTFAPSDTGIAFQFRLAKRNEFDWLQVVDVQSKVHRFEEHPKVAKPEVRYPAMLQPNIIVVPVRPKPGIFEASMLFEPLDDVQEFLPSATTHRPVHLTSLQSQPLELRETSPQPLVVLITAEAPGIYEMSVRMKVVADGHEQWIPLCERSEFTFTTPERVNEAIEQWGQLPAKVQKTLESEREQYLSTQ